MSRYREAKQPPLAAFAPYAAFVLRVDLVFHLAIEVGLISANRPSNMVDVAYLYYLPFCMVFASNDRLHARLAPLFMELGQTFVLGDELKACLAELDLYYSFLPEEVKASGLMTFAVYPPEHLDSLVTRLWDKYLPRWRDDARLRRESPRDRSRDASIIAEINKTLEEAKPIDADVPVDTATHVVIRRTIPAQKGKWRLVPARLVEESEGDLGPGGTTQP